MSSHLDASSFEIVTVEDRGRCLMAKRGLHKDEVVIEEPPVCFISYNTSTSLIFPTPAPSSKSRPTDGRYIDSDDEYDEDDKDGASSNSEAIVHPWLSWDYRPHELQLIKDMNGNIMAVSLSLLAARVIECLMREEEDDGGFHEADLSLLCKPAAKISVKQETKLQIASLITLKLLQDINVEVTDERCLEVVLRLSCNVFTITDAESSPIALGLYNLSSSINHSCNPSCNQSFNGLLLKITSSNAMEGPREVTISYSDSSKSTWCRRKNLFEAYYFICNCERCSEVDILDGFLCRATAATDSTTAIPLPAIPPLMKKVSYYPPCSGLCRPCVEFNDKTIFTDTDSASLTMIAAFLEDTCLPFGDLWIDLLTEQNCTSSAAVDGGSPISALNSNKSDKKKNTNSSSSGGGGGGEASGGLMELFLGLDEKHNSVSFSDSSMSNSNNWFNCSHCRQTMSFGDALMYIKPVYDLWIRYQALLLDESAKKSSDPSDVSPTLNNANPNRILVLKRLQSQISVLESMLASMLTFVQPTHYSMVQLSDKLVNALMESSGIYDWLLTKSPGNSKLVAENRVMMEKYTKYAEMLMQALATCYPKYKN